MLQTKFPNTTSQPTTFFRQLVIVGSSIFGPFFLALTQLKLLKVIIIVFF